MIDDSAWFLMMNDSAKFIKKVVRVKEMIPQRNLNEIANSLVWNGKPVQSVLASLYSCWFGKLGWLLNMITWKILSTVSRLDWETIVELETFLDRW